MARIEITITDEGWTDQISCYREKDGAGKHTGFWVVEQEEIADYPYSLGDSYKIRVPNSVVMRCLYLMVYCECEIGEIELKDWLENPRDYELVRRSEK